MTEDPRLSDEATGLPPLEELGTDETMLVLGWASGEGVVASPFTGRDEAVRFLHLRGLVSTDDPGYKAEWGQIHIAIPVEHALDVAVSLAGGKLG